MVNIDLNKQLKEINKDVWSYVIYDQLPPLTGDDEENWVLDIEVCPTDESKKEVLTYSIAIMDTSGSNICYKYNNISKCLADLLNIDSVKVNIYIHNLFYDIKPFIIELFNTYGKHEVEREYYYKTEFNPFKKKEEELIYQSDEFLKFTEPFQYNSITAKGQMYQFSIAGRIIKRRFKNKKRYVSFPSNIVFKDTLKMFPFSLQTCCSAYLGLDLPKDGLDYDKIRKADDELTKEEMIYIYNDVYGLSHLVKTMIIEGFELNGRLIRNDKLTASGQSLSDYKLTLLEDFKNKQNAFANDDVYFYVDNNLDNNGYFKAKTIEKQADAMFKSLYPVTNFFEYAFIKHSYFGGLCCVDYDNVAKFEKQGEKEGLVFDVNSLYPSMMMDNLLPYGKGYFSEKPYRDMNEDFKKQYPLYVQEITIHDMKVKKDKMHWVQVKDRLDFNGREVIKENINLKGEKVTIKLVLTNVLMDLLFECYDIGSYELGFCVCYQGSYHLFDNYINFWSDVKKNNKGAMRQTAKNRLNTLYGKFGSSAESEITELGVEDDIFKMIHYKDYYVRTPIYLPMASFITSYAKRFLVNAINHNREYFVYCDTDSIHLVCSKEEVKGITIHDKNFSCWANEMEFSDFRYIGAKRYAEKDKESGEWHIKCCGLTDRIMKQVKDIDVFCNCPIPQKELNKMQLYTKDDDVYYYKDKECTEKIKGLFKSSKAKQVKNGTIIIEQPYAVR